MKALQRSVRLGDHPPSISETTPLHGSQALLVFGIVMLALNMRPTIAGVGPLLPQMQREFHVSGGIISLLTTIPVYLFGLLAPVVPWLSRKFNIERILLGCIAAIAVGASLRMGPSLAWVLGGTAVLGGGIAGLNVLLPGLVKRDFPDRTGLMTGIYIMALCGGASLAAGLAAPFRDLWGGAWRPSLGIWALLAAVGVLAWMPTYARRKHHAVLVPPAGRALWQDPVAWQVTMYMGLQSLVFYAWLTWLPKLLQDSGMPARLDGLPLCLGNLVQIPVALVFPLLATRMRDQRAIAVSAALSLFAGLVGLLLAPASAPFLWALLLGVGSGGTLAVGLSLIVLRARDSLQVARLSAMAQGVGYTLAGSGPFLFGYLHDLTGQWGDSVRLLMACSLGIALAGLGAGRAVFVEGSQGAEGSARKAHLSTHALVVGSLPIAEPIPGAPPGRYRRTRSPRARFDCRVR